MTRHLRRWLVTLLLVVSAAPHWDRVVRAGETVSITLPKDAITLPAGPGAGVAQTQCAFCHSLDYITTQPPGPHAQWRGVVTKMIKVFGAPINDADATAIVEYLGTHYTR